ncbi:MAG: hypothetical protein ACRBI6_03205 [Acidimicrobiales bacterium]
MDTMLRRRSRSRSRRRQVPAAIGPAAIGVVLALLAAGCAELAEPDYGVGSVASVTSSTVAGSDAVAIDSPSTTIAAATTGDVFVPPRPEGYVPELLVATDQGVVVADLPSEVVGASSVRRLGDPLGSLSSPRLVGDYFGGVVAEGGDGVVRWYRDAASEPTVVSETGTLLDVGFLDDRFEVQVFVGGAGAGAAIDQVRLADGERAEFATLLPTERLIDFAASDGVQVAAVSDDACGRLVFFDAEGDRVDLGDFAVPECPVAGRAAFGSVSIDVDSVVAYTEQSYRSDGLVAGTDVVVRRLGSGAEELRLTVGGPGETISSLTFDGMRIAFVRSSIDGAAALVAVDATASGSPIGGETGIVIALPLLDDPTAPPVPVAVAFTRQPLVVAGEG